jgi:hypothetical protein
MAKIVDNGFFLSTSQALRQTWAGDGQVVFGAIPDEIDFPDKH